MKQVFLIIASLALLLSACTGNTRKDDAKAGTSVVTNQPGDMPHDSQQTMSGTMGQTTGISSISVKRSQTVSDAISAYLEIEDALVTDDGSKSAEAGKNLVTALNNVDKSSVTDGKISELEKIIEDAIENADHISENKRDIEHQREHFEMLGTDIKDLVAIAGADRTLYQIFCPMYNNNEGGTWLSASSEIKNPFFGNKMLTCGRVESVISVR